MQTKPAFLKTEWLCIFAFVDYDEHERSLLISQMSFEKTFGLSTVFIESTLLENGGVADSANSSTLIKEAIHVISCGYEEKTAWGKEVRMSLYKHNRMSLLAVITDGVKFVFL